VSTHYVDQVEQADRLVVMANGIIVAEGTTADVIDGRCTVEVTTDRWSKAFDALDDDRRRVSLAGRRMRVLAETVARVTAHLEQAGISAKVDLVRATLDKTMVELNP